MRGVRLQRILKLIALLRSNTVSWNARKLAEYFQISRRNVYRDLAVMELAGIPYTYDPDFGEGGGYRIRPDFWFPTVGLSNQECFDLAILVKASEDRNIPLVSEAATVRDKLITTLPHSQQELIRESVQLFDILGLNIADHSHCRKFMTTLQASLLSNRQVEGKYNADSGRRCKSVRLQPRRVFLSGHAWYVAAHDNVDGKTKLYRLSRFKELKLIQKPITVSKPLSLREILGNAWRVHRGEKEWQVEILFEPTAEEFLCECNWHNTQELIKQPNGKILFKATVSGLDEIRWWILSWGSRANVIKPKELIDAIRSELGQSLKNYTHSPKS